MIDTLGWNITARCNMRCRHCYIGDRVSRNDEQQYDAIKQCLPRFVDAEIKKVFVSGGEPLLRRDLIEILELLCSEYETQLITNGSLITYSLLDDLKGAGIAKLRFGFETARKRDYEALRIDGNFEDVLKGIRISRRRRVRVTLDTVSIHPLLGTVRDLFKFAADQGCDGVALKRFIPSGRGKDHTEELALKPFQLRDLFSEWFEVSCAYQDRIKSFVHDPLYAVFIDQIHGDSQQHSGCRAGTDWLGISPEGYVSPCPLLGEPILGSTNGERVSSLSRRSLGWANQFPIYSACEFSQKCLGGCKAWRAKYHSICDPLCWIRESYTPAGLENRRGCQGSESHEHESK